MAASPRICKEFESHMVEKKIDGKMVMVRSWCFISEDQDCPDLLVKRQMGGMLFGNPSLDLIEPEWVDFCAFEFKFGMDLVNSLNSRLLLDELTRMKRKYTRPVFDLPPPDKYASIGELERFVKEGEEALKTPFTSIPLYLVIVNEPFEPNLINSSQQTFCISHNDLMWAVGIALDLNIRPIYCSHSGIFAKKVFSLIRTPPSEVDLGQRFVIKSSGSEFNRSLQCYHGVTRSIADKIEYYWKNMEQFINQSNTSVLFLDELSECFVTESGRFMKANMEKFLRKVSGK